MALLSNDVINTRDDLDAIHGTVEWALFMSKLKGSMQRKQDVQVYPEGYNMPDYDGPKLDPIWEFVEDLSTIHAFGFEKSDFDDVKSE